MKTPARCLTCLLLAATVAQAGVRAGGDRQDLHERVRVHSREAARRVKAEGESNPLMELLIADPAFAQIKHQLADLLDPMHFIGRSAEQVDSFLAEEVEPRLVGCDFGGETDELRV